MKIFPCETQTHEPLNIGIVLVSVSLISIVKSISELSVLVIIKGISKLSVSLKGPFENIGHGNR